MTAPTVRDLSAYPTVAMSPAQFALTAFNWTQSLANFSGDINALSEWINENIDARVVSDKTGTAFSLTVDDSGAYIRTTNASAKVLTVELDSVALFPDGATFLIKNIGAGTLTITPAVGVTINDNLALSQSASAILQKIGANLYDLITIGGDFVTDLTALTADVALKAYLSSPALTGNPTAPTAATGDNDTSIANTAFVQGEIAKLKASTFSSLATTASTSGQIVIITGHTTAGIGGGSFIDKAGTITNDIGSKINNTITAGRYWHRLAPQKTPYEFGYLDGGVDASTAINACIAAYGDCFLDGGKTYDIQYQIDSPKRLWGVGGVATLNCTSPTANTRFGSLNAAVYALGGVGDPLAGVDIQNITIDCNKLIGVSGSTGIKGFLFQRLDNFYQRNCKVFDCASYGFWDYDVATTGTTYCSGTRDDCTAIDCGVGFEQVNVRGVTLNNCYGYVSSATLGYAPECIYHAYGGSDMQIVYNNCVGIADGACPAIFLGLLEVKNITMNDCTFLNNYNNGASIQAAVFLDASGTSNFDNILFKNCTLKSQYTVAVTLADGSASTTDNTFRFINCEIEGYQVGVQFNVNQGRYYFTDCDIRGRATLAVTPYAIYNNGTPTEVKVIGGFCKSSTTGGATPLITNMATSIFTSTTFDPVGTQPPRVRQKVTGIAVFGGDGSTYANLNVSLPSAALNWTSAAVNTCNVTGSLIVDYGISGAANLPAAVAMAYPVVGAMVANNIFRFVGNTVLNGKTARYEVTEWE